MINPWLTHPRSASPVEARKSVMKAWTWWERIGKPWGFPMGQSGKFHGKDVEKTTRWRWIAWRIHKSLENSGLKQMESMGKMMKINWKSMGKWGTNPFANIEYFWIFQENMEHMFETWKANDGRTQLARCMEKCMERPIKHIDNGNDLDKLIGHIHIRENNTEST